MTARQRSLLIEEPPLQIIPGLAKEIGLNEAIILQQIHYWLGRSENEREGRRWVYKTTQEWAEEFPFWSEATIKRAICNLRRLSLIIVTKRSATSWERVNWYTVDYESLSNIGSKCSDASDQSDPMHVVKTTESIGSKSADRSGQSDLVTLTTETTSENTTRKGATRPGVDYTPSPSVLAWVQKNGFEPYLQLHIEQFRDTCETQQRKPYQASGLDAAFRKSVREDWGDVRRKRQMEERHGSVPAAAWRPCAYCGKPSNGSVGGIFSCAAHTHDALDGKPVPKREDAHA